MDKISSIVTLLCTLLACTIINVNQAQAQIGVKGGINMANLYDTDIDTESRVGLSAGLFTNISLPAIPLSIQPEVLYSQKGAKETDTFNGNEVTVKTMLDYIEVPVLAKLNFPTPGPVSPNLFLGPYAAFNIKAEAEVEGDGGGTIGGDIKDSVTDTDFGLVAGVGINVLSKFTFDVRYSAGFTPIDDTENGGNSKNSVISFTAGINL